MHAATGLVVAPYRAYEATFGRWVSEDPIGLRGGLNRYAYVDGDPIGISDPLGLAGKGERGKTGKPEGTDDPFKKMKPHPTDPSKVKYKDPHTGKEYDKPKPEGFDEWWKKKHPMTNFCEKNPGTCATIFIVVAGVLIAICIAQPELTPAVAAGGL